MNKITFAENMVDNSIINGYSWPPPIHGLPSNEVTKRSQEILLFMYYMYYTNYIDPNIMSIHIDHETFQNVFYKLKNRGNEFVEFNNVQDFWSILFELKLLQVLDQNQGLYILKFDSLNLNNVQVPIISEIPIVSTKTSIGTETTTNKDIVSIKTTTTINRDEDINQDYYIDLIILLCYLKIRNVIGDDRTIFKFLLVNEILRLQRSNHLKWIQIDNATFVKLFKKFIERDSFQKYVLSENSLDIIQSFQSEFENSTFYNLVTDQNQKPINLSVYENENILDIFHYLNQRGYIIHEEGTIFRCDVIRLLKFLQDHNLFLYIDSELIREYFINCEYIEEFTPKLGDTFNLTDATMCKIEAVDVYVIPIQERNGYCTTLINKKNTVITCNDDSNSNIIRDFLYYLFLEKKIPNDCRFVKKSLLAEESRCLMNLERSKFAEFKSKYLMPLPEYDTLLMTTKLFDEFQSYKDIYYKSYFYETVTNVSPQIKEVMPFVVKRSNQIILYDFLCYLKDKYLNADCKTIRLSTISDEFSKLQIFRGLELLKGLDAKKLTSYLFGLHKPRAVLRTNDPDMLLVTDEFFQTLSDYDENYRQSKIYNVLNLLGIGKNLDDSKTHGIESTSNIFKLCTNSDYDNFFDFLYYLRSRKMIPENRLVKFTTVDCAFATLKEHNLLPNYHQEKLFDYLLILKHAVRIDDVLIEFTEESMRLNEKYGQMAYDYSDVKKLDDEIPLPGRATKTKRRKVQPKKALIANNVHIHHIGGGDAVIQQTDDINKSDEPENCYDYLQNRCEYIATYKRDETRDLAFYKSCVVCQANFINKFEFKMHLLEHNENRIQINDTKVDCQFSLKCEMAVKSVNLDFHLTNLGPLKTIEQVVMFHPNNIIVRINNDMWPITLTQGARLLIKPLRTRFTKAPHRYEIVIHFTSAGKDYVELHSFFLAQELPKLVNSTLNQKLENKKTELGTRNVDMELLRMPKQTLKMDPLADYPPSDLMHSLFEKGYVEGKHLTAEEHKVLKVLNRFSKRPMYNRLSASNYTKMLTRLIEMEDIQCDDMIKGFDKSNQTFEYRLGCYSLMIENLEEHRPSLLPKDEIFIYPEFSGTCTAYAEQSEIRGQIKVVEKDSILIELLGDVTLDTSRTYRVRFEHYRMNFRQALQAIEIIEHQNLSKFFFPSTIPTGRAKNIALKWFNKNIESNPEQKQAVTNIVQGLGHPVPYIIFGPPGTGKTMTIVEAIVQIYTIYPSSRILIVTGSNSACNEITKRLLNYIPNEEMLRMFALAQELIIDQIDYDILYISNLATGKHFYPALDVITTYRVVLSTVTVAGKLVNANIDPYHFTHVFIDECASITEALALVPICGMVTTEEKLHGHIILAGDPLQLGPINYSNDANKLGLGISMLDRLMNMKIYQKDPITEKYNPAIITKLLRNFRSHPAILKLPNELFYEGDLLAKASPETINWALNWKHLPNPEIPIVFRSVSGHMKQEKNSPSSFNQEEIKVVEKYLKLLLHQTINGKFIDQSDIGIVSPYVKQCKKIRDYCEQQNWSNIEVASVETFQGREKSIIIISTVRSDTKKLGFLTNKRRLNVAITRAKGLLIVVGDPKLLERDFHWRKFIKYCIDNKCMAGEKFELSLEHELI